MNAPLAVSEATSGMFSLVPQNLVQAMELAKLIADSELAPKDYRGKPGNVLIAVQMGQEVGLSPMSSIQSIAVINGKPGLYGDVGKAILLSHGLTIEEDDVETIKKTGAGRCKITRKGHPPCERTFSTASAKTAGLWGKSGPWTQYPERQMAWRAFWFAARDVAADLLKGLSGAEEVIDIQPEKDITPKAAEPAQLKDQRGAYPDEQFALNLPKWRDLIASGKKTADQIISVVQSKHTLSDAQKAEIRKPATPADTGTLATPEQLADIRTRAEVAALTELDIQAKFNRPLAGLPAAMVADVLAFIADPMGE